MKTLMLLFVQLYFLCSCQTQLIHNKQYTIPKLRTNSFYPLESKILKYFIDCSKETIIYGFQSFNYEKNNCTFGTLFNSSGSQPMMDLDIYVPNTIIRGIPLTKEQQ